MQFITPFIPNLIVKKLLIYDRLLLFALNNNNKIISCNFFANHIAMASNPIDVSTMFSYSSRTNIPWNISEYEPQRQYLDHLQIKQDNEKKENKYVRYSARIPRKINQKTFFIEQEIKPLKENPSPDKYKSLSIFDQTQNRKKSKTTKINPRLSKYTYLDWIEKQSKKIKKPAVGKYNLMKTDKEIKEQIRALSMRKQSYEQKRHFYDGNQTNDVPGAGNYNPHLQVKGEPKASKKNYKWWIDQHKKLAVKQRKKQHKSLAPNSYRPVSASYNSFDKIELDFKKQQKKGKDKKAHRKLGFSSADSRFTYTRQKKVKIQEKRPGSTAYNTFIEWKGKIDPEPRKKGWTRCLSAGPSRSVYH